MHSSVDWVVFVSWMVIWYEWIRLDSSVDEVRSYFGQ